MLATARMVFALVVAFWPNQNSMVNNVFFSCTLIGEYKISANEPCFVAERRLVEELGAWSLYCPSLTKSLLLVFWILIAIFGIFLFWIREAVYYITAPSLGRRDCYAKYTASLYFVAQLLGNVDCCLAGWAMWFFCLWIPGNSLSAILDGEGRLTFLNRGEDYVMTMPYAHCKGSGFFSFSKWQSYENRSLLF